MKTEAGKSAKQSVVELEHRIKDLAEIIKYAQQYKDNRSYHIGYKKAKNPDAYFRRYESQIILYGGARHMLEQAGINLKGLNVDKLKAEYQELMKQKMVQLQTKRIGAYLRKMAIDGYIIYVDTRDIKEMNKLLSAIGRNINQIAKRINAGGSAYQADMDEIRERLDEIWQLQRHILSNQR